MSLFGKRDQYSDAPKNAINDKGETGQAQFGNTVFGVSDAESQAARGDGKGSVPPGWVKVTTGTGGRAGRVTYETVACAGITGDATDFANTSTLDVANTTGAADDSTFADS
jgi:hypothetical protein